MRRDQRVGRGLALFTVLLVGIALLLGSAAYVAYRIVTW